MKRNLVLALFLLAMASSGSAQTLSSSLWDGFDWKMAGDKTHRALGYITPALGLSAYLVMAGQGDEGPASPGHRLLGTAAAWAGGANLVLGLVTHWDRIQVWNDPSQLWSRDTLHALVAGAGAASMALAGLRGGEDGHSTFGEAGTALMGAAILLEW